MKTLILGNKLYMISRQNFVCAALFFFGFLLPDWYLGYVTKMLSCTIPFTTLISVLAFSFVLSMVKSHKFLFAIVALVTIAQAVQLNHWAYFGAPINSQDITKAFVEFDEVFDAGASMVSDLWPVWLAQALSLAFFVAAVVYTKKCRHTPFMWGVVLLALAVNPMLSYLKGHQLFHTKPISSTFHNTLRAFSDWLVNKQVKLHDFHYKPYVITYGKPKVKNVVFIMGESVSSRYMQLYGYGEPNTPFLEKLKSDTNFAYTKGISSSVDTLTGLQLFFNNGHNPGFTDLINSKAANLFRLARHQGYKTFLISAQGEGLFHEIGTQFIDIYSFKKDTLKSLKEKGDEALFDVLIGQEFGDKNFIVIHLRHIHEPYSNWEKYFPVLEARKTTNSRELQTRNEYSHAIAYHDHWVKECITCIKKILPSDTVVVFTSDHGQLVGEDGLFGHNLMRSEVVDVPVWAYAINTDHSLNHYIKSQKICSHYDLGKQIAKLFGAEIANPNEDPTLQFVHGTQLHTNYEYMPWKKTNGKAEFLKTEKIGVTAK